MTENNTYHEKPTPQEMRLLAQEGRAACETMRVMYERLQIVKAQAPGFISLMFDTRVAEADIQAAIKAVETLVRGIEAKLEEKADRRKGQSEYSGPERRGK